MPRQIGDLTLYSVDDLHRQLGLSKVTIRAYLRDGKIRARKLGVKWYVTESALKDYFEERNTADNTSRKEKGYYYLVQGINDLVSEQEKCDTIGGTVECLKEQAILSLLQVAVVDRENEHIVEVMKAHDFLARYQKK
jgi:excisionase family DNA binding protein